MKGIICHFRGSQRRKQGNQMILIVPEVDSREKAEKLVGKALAWTSPGKQKKEIKGKISAPHGNKGAVRAIFEKGLPGQSLGEEVAIQ